MRFLWICCFKPSMFRPCFLKLPRRRCGRAHQGEEWKVRNLVGVVGWSGVKSCFLGYVRDEKLPSQLIFFSIFTPNFGEDEQILTYIFQMGWFNPQFCSNEPFFLVHFVGSTHLFRCILNTPPPPGLSRVSRSPDWTQMCVVSFQCGKGRFCYLTWPWWKNTCTELFAIRPIP